MDISEYYPSLAVFAFLTFISAICGLSEVFGTPTGDYVYGFIVSKKWTFITEKNYMGYCRFFSVIYYLLLAMPPVTIAVWVGIMFYLRRDDTFVGPLSVLLVSLAGICAVLGQRFIVWRRYRLNYVTGTLLVLSILFMVGFQLLANFYYSLDYSFFGISAIFLSYNCILVIVIIYLNIAKNFVTFQDLLKEHVKDKAENYVPHGKHKDLVKGLEEDLVNDKYVLTTAEYNSFITIGSDSNKMGTAGPENMFSNLSFSKQMTINVILYAFSLLMLVAYSIISYKTEYEKLGLTISIAVVATDIMLFTLYHSRVLSTILETLFMAVIFRGCLFGFGGEYWFYGCCLLFALSGIKTAYAKIKQQFPFVETKRQSLKVPVTGRGSNVRYTLDVLREPLIAWLFCTIIFAVLTVILAFTEPNGVYLPSLYLGHYRCEFWLMAILAFLLIVFCYFVMAAIRLRILKSMRYIPRVYRYFLREGISEFWIYVSLAYIVIVSTALILYYFVRSYLLITYSCFIPFIGIVSIYGSLMYAENEFSILYKFQKEMRKELLRKRKADLAKARALQPRLSPLEFDSGFSDEVPEDQSEPKEDWRKSTWFLPAFLQGKLPTRDYKIIASLVILTMAVFFLGFTIQMLGDNSDLPEAWIGVTSAVTVFCYILISGSLLDHLTNGLRLTIGEMLLLGIGVIGYIAYGIGFYQVREDGDMDINYNIYSFPIYAAIFPCLLTAFLGSYSRFIRGRTSKVCFILWGLTIVSLGILIGYVYFLFGVKEGTITLGIIVFLVIGITFISVMAYLSFKARIITGAIVFLIACAVMIYDFCEDEMDNFIGFSISYLLITGGVFLAVGYSVFKSLLGWRTTPVIFSSGIFPTFKYKPLLGYPIEYYGKIYIMYIAIGAFLLWSTLLSIYVEPMRYGVSAGIFAIIGAIIMSIYFSTYTSYSYKVWKEHITSKTINSAWLMAKGRYIQRQGVTTLQELQTFHETLNSKKRLIELDAEIRTKKSQIALSSARDRDYLNLSYREKLIWLHKADERINSLFLDELIFMILFQMLTLMSAQNATNKEQQELVRFVRTYKAELKKHGIRISFTNITDLDLRYCWILSQRQNMTPEQQVAFNNEFARYQEEKQQKEKEKREAEEKIQKQLNEKLEMEHDENSGRNIAKYKEIVESYKRTNRKYLDPEFPCSNENLGPELSKSVSAWRRATDDPTAKIFQGKACPMDLIQGELGDCYLLSAISVMGEKNIHLCIKSNEEQGRSGAFLVKLFRGGEYEEYILIDDFFPLAKDGKWLLARCETIEKNQGLQMWPMILEKAYAKLYKSYSLIKGGKVHLALAEFTGGIPHQIKITAEVKDNIEEFWEMLYAYHDNGYMLGAGTPNGPGGINSVNANGIVQGHAYAILNIADYGGEKLIKLRNPHGSRGAEWNGDWSDESPLWTPAAIEELQLEISTDGVFWMNASDFVDEFDNIYICRKFDKRWTVIYIEDYCLNEYALNTHGFEMFPQYEVSITKPSAIFIKMTQSQKVSSFQGKYAIFVMIIAKDGKLAYKVDKTKNVASSLPPINSVSVTAELFADAFYAYPCKFTVVAGMNDSKSEFTLNFYSTDNAFQVRKIN